MLRKITGLDMAYSEATVELAMTRVAEEFGVQVTLDTESDPYSGGWPLVTVVGTARQLWTMLTSPGGWSCGDPDEDAEVALLWLKDATTVEVVQG